ARPRGSRGRCSSACTCCWRWRSSSRRRGDREAVGIGDQGSGIRDQGSGIGDQGSGIRDQASGIRDQGSGIKSIDLGRTARQISSGTGLVTTVARRAIPVSHKYSRRQFLEQAAMAGGALAVGGTAALAAKPALPNPRNSGIEHIVVMMMENRSFDHLLGWLPGADGRQAGLTYTDAAGVAYSTYPLAPDYQGCGH